MCELAIEAMDHHATEMLPEALKLYGPLAEVIQVPTRATCGEREFCNIEERIVNGTREMERRERKFCKIEERNC